LGLSPRNRDAAGGTIEYFRDTVFNCPTLAEAYKAAALDGLNKL
jgi:NAD(P) transhydrogenase